MNLSKHCLILLFVFSGLIGCSISSSHQQTSTPTTTQVSTQSFKYSDYASVLKTYVNTQGQVNYQGLQKNREQLDRFIVSIGEVSPSTYAAWNEPEKIAFLINAYNAFTLQAIIDQNPLPKSIRDISGVWKWDQHKIAGESKTLDNIEHDTLRTNFNEPRIHVALVCAAKSCPPLRNEPYYGDTLNTQLDEQVRRFIASSHGLRIEQQNNSIYLSSIFKWFGDDWKKSYGIQDKFTGNESERAVLNFLSNYLQPSLQSYLQQGNYKIHYLEYDWSLNKQE